MTFVVFLSFDFFLLSPCTIEQWLVYHRWYMYHSLINPALNCTKTSVHKQQAGRWGDETWLNKIPLRTVVKWAQTSCEFKKSRHTGSESMADTRKVGTSLYTPTVGSDEQYTIQ